MRVNLLGAKKNTTFSVYRLDWLILRFIGLYSYIGCPLHGTFRISLFFDYYTMYVRCTHRTHIHKHTYTDTNKRPRIQFDNVKTFDWIGLDWMERRTSFLVQWKVTGSRASHSIRFYWARCVRDNMRLYWNTLCVKLSVGVCVCILFPLLLYGEDICIHLMNKKTEHTNFILSEIDPDTNERGSAGTEAIRCCFFSWVRSLLSTERKNHFQFPWVKIVCNTQKYEQILVLRHYHKDFGRILYEIRFCFMLRDTLYNLSDDLCFNMYF